MAARKLYLKAISTAFRQQIIEQSGSAVCDPMGGSPLQLFALFAALPLIASAGSSLQTAQSSSRRTNSPPSAIPKPGQANFNVRRIGGPVMAVRPEGAPPGADHRKSRRPKPAGDSNRGPSDDPPAPAPASESSPGAYWLNGENQVRDFIHALVHYGGYNEMADILVNLTSLASELAKLVSEGFSITVLAPGDEAMGRLTAAQLSRPGAPERIVYYHIIPEYQTEESLYNAVRRFGRVSFHTLRIPHKVSAREADGTVLFGEGEGTAHLYDHDIYIDGRISVQGVDRVLFPPEHSKGRKLEEEEAA